LFHQKEKEKRAEPLDVEPALGDIEAYLFLFQTTGQYRSLYILLLVA
jgi:hypothetical protein